VARRAPAANNNINEDRPNDEVEPGLPINADQLLINAKQPETDPEEPEDPVPPPPEPFNMDAAPDLGAPAFALTPAAAHQNILDYTRPEHAKLFNKAIAPLEGDEYDGTPENLKGFLDRLQQKAEDYTWL
jgi:hypothetical protein